MSQRLKKMVAHEKFAKNNFLQALQNDKKGSLPNVTALFYTCKIRVIYKLALCKFVSKFYVISVTFLASPNYRVLIIKL